MDIVFIMVSYISYFQLTNTEKKASLLEVDDKNAQRKLIAMDAENCKLKEETSKYITQVGFTLMIFVCLIYP